MRLTPEEFEQIYSIFIGIILLFFAFGGIKILMFKFREKEPPPRRPATPGGGGTGEYRRDSAGTFGTSGIGASDMSPAGINTTTPASGSEVASASWESSDMGGGDSGGGGDYSGGGGDSGGGGSSGSWS